MYNRESLVGPIFGTPLPPPSDAALVRAQSRGFKAPCNSKWYAFFGSGSCVFASAFACRTTCHRTMAECPPPRLRPPTHTLRHNSVWSVSFRSDVEANQFAAGIGLAFWGCQGKPNTVVHYDTAPGSGAQGMSPGRPLPPPLVPPRRTALQCRRRRLANDRKRLVINRWQSAVNRLQSMSPPVGGGLTAVAGRPADAIGWPTGVTSH